MVNGTMLAVLAAADAMDAAAVQMAARWAAEGSDSSGGDASTKPTALSAAITAARAWALAACPWLLKLQQGQSALAAVLAALEGPLLVSSARLRRIGVKAAPALPLAALCAGCGLSSTFGGSRVPGVRRWSGFFRRHACPSTAIAASQAGRATWVTHTAAVRAAWLKHTAAVLFSIKHLMERLPRCAEGGEAPAAAGM